MTHKEFLRQLNLIYQSTEDPYIRDKGRLDLLEESISDLLLEYEKHQI